MRARRIGAVAVAVTLAVAGGWIYASDDDEQEIAIADLPAAVVDAIENKFPEARLLEAEQETENGQTVYEVEIDDDGEELEVEVTADGKILEVEADDDDSEDDD